MQNSVRRQVVPEARPGPEPERRDSGHTEGHRADTPNPFEPRSPDPTPSGDRRRALWACPLSVHAETITSPMKIKPHSLATTDLLSDPC